MKIWQALLVVTALGCSSCSTTKPASKNQTRPTVWDGLTSTPIYTVAMFSNGTVDILYCCWSFRSKNDRWPKDYPELSAYVKGSDGYLMLADHPGAELKVLPNDALEIGWVPRGLTNQMKITLGPPGPRP